MVEQAFIQFFVAYSMAGYDPDDAGRLAMRDAKECGSQWSKLRS
jgi:hypothetical protein